MQENANNQGLTLKDFFSVIWSKKWLVLIITVAITALTAAGSLIFTKTKYTASCTMLVVSSSNATGEVDANRCVIILNSQNFFETIVESKIGDSNVTIKEKYGWTKDKLREKVEFVVVENVGGAFQISFQSTDAVEAKEVMDVIFEKTINLMEVSGVVKVTPIESVHEPLPESRQILLKTAIGGVCGLCIAIISAFVVRSAEKNKAQKAEHTEQLAA